MTLLPRQDRLLLEELLGLGGGHVMDLTNRELSDLVREQLAVEIEHADYAARRTSKANRLRTLIESAEPEKIARLLRVLWGHREHRRWTPNDVVEAQPSMVRARFMAVVEWLERQAGHRCAFPPLLGRHARRADRRDQPRCLGRDVSVGAHAAALDRLHTYSCKRSAHLLSDHGLDCLGTHASFAHATTRSPIRTRRG